MEIDRRFEKGFFHLNITSGVALSPAHIHKSGLAVTRPFINFKLNEHHYVITYVPSGMTAYWRKSKSLAEMKEILSTAVSTTLYPTAVETSTSRR